RHPICPVHQFHCDSAHGGQCINRFHCGSGGLDTVLHHLHHRRDSRHAAIIEGGALERETAGRGRGDRTTRAARASGEVVMTLMTDKTMHGPWLENISMTHGHSSAPSATDQRRGRSI